jgi:hypothetical protein
MHDFDEFEEALKAGALYFGGLFGGLAFGKENQAVTLGQIGQRFRDTIENFWRCAFEFDDALMDQRKRFPLRHLVRKLQVRLFEGAAKAAHAIAVLANILALGLVQNVPNIGAGVAGGLYYANKIFDQLLEENIVFPERVVGVDQQCVASHGDPFVAPLRELRLHRMAVYQPKGIFGDGRGGVRAGQTAGGFPRDCSDGAQAVL